MKNKKIAFILLAFLGFLANGDNYAASALISNIAVDLGIPVSSAAASVTAYMATYGLFTLIYGPLADRFGKAKIIKIAGIGTAIFSLIAAASYSLPSLVVLRALNGAFGAGIFPITIALVGEMYDDKDRHKKIALMMSVGFLGGALASAIGGTISYLGSWRTVYLIYGVGELIAAVLILKYLKPDKAKTSELHFIKGYKVALSDRRVLGLVSIVFLIGFSVLGSYTYMGTYILDNTSLNILVVGIILSLYGFGTVFGSKTIVPLRKKHPKTVMITSAVIGSLSLLTFAFSGHIVFMGIALLSFGFSYISIQSTLVTTIQEKLTGIKGTAMSLIAFNLFVGAAIGTQVNSMVISRFTMSTVFVVSAIILTFAGIFAQISMTKFEIEKKSLVLEGFR